MMFFWYLYEIIGGFQKHAAFPQFALMRKRRFQFLERTMTIHRKVSLSHSSLHSHSYNPKTQMFFAIFCISLHSLLLLFSYLKILQIMAHQGTSDAFAFGIAPKFSPLKLFPVSAFMPRKLIRATTFDNSSLHY